MADEKLQDLDYDEVFATNANLLTEFRCHVYLGQWELARACALTVLRAPFTTDDDKQFVRNYFKELAVRPEALSTCASPSIVSPHHLSWLASKFLEENFPDEDASTLKQDAEFRVLLHCVGTTYPKECLEELRRLYSEAHAVNQTLTTECCSCLYHSLLQSTLEAHLFLTFLLQALPENGASASQIRQIYLKVEVYLLKQLKVSPSRSEDSRRDVKTTALHVLSLIPESAFECSESKALLDSIFADLIDLLDNDVLGEGEVLGRMVCRKTPQLLQVFSDRLNEHKGRRKSLQEDADVEEKRLAVNPQTGELDIKEAFLKSVISGEHFARTLVKYAVQRLILGNAETARRLFTNELLHNLYPVALYSAWDSVHSNETAQNIMQAAQDSKGWTCPEPILQGLLERMQYNLNVMQWVLEMYKKRKPETAEAQERSFLRNTYDMLRRLSPLVVLHKTLGLARLDRNDVLKLLDSAPRKENMHGSGEAEVLSTSVKEREERTNLVNASPDTILYCGYLALQRAMDGFYVAVLLDRATSCAVGASKVSAELKEDGGNNVELWELPKDADSVAAAVGEHGFREVYKHTVLARLQRFQDEVCSLYPLTFRLELLEDAFSLLFVTQADLKDDEDRSTAEETDYDCGSEELDGTTLVDESSVATKEVQSTFDRRPSASREASRGASAKGSTASSSGGGRDAGGVSGAGFLCPHFLVPDVLHCLNSAVIATQATAFAVGAARDKAAAEDESPVISTSVTWKEFPARLEALRKHVAEAQWRYELVASSSDFGRRSRTLATRSFPSLERADRADTPSSGKEYRRHRRRKRRSVARIDSGDATIIEKMLSTFEALLRHCLWRGDYQKAHQIVELLDLGNSPDAHELSFCEGLSDLKQSLAQISHSPSPPPPSDSCKAASTASGEVGRAAQAGLRLTSVTTAVEKFFGSISLPRIPEAERLLQSSHEEQTSTARWLATEYGVGGLHAAAVADLAITGKLPCDVSERILAMAKFKRRTDGKHAPSGTKWRGLSATTERIQLLLQESAGVEKCGNVERMMFAPGATNTLTDLLCGYIGDMDPKVLMGQRSALRELGEQLDQVKSLLKASEVPIDGYGDKNKLHKAFFRLTEMSGKQLRPQLSFLPAFRFDYLRCAYAHARQLHKAICEVARQGRLKVKRPGGNYFWVLSQSPSALLSDTIFKDEIHPVRLEDLAKRMKINLVQVVAQACCPPLPLRCSDDTPDSSTGSASPLKILNDTTSPCMTARHPYHVVEHLLKSLKTLLNTYCDFGDCVVTLPDAHKLGNSVEFSAWATDCAEIGFVDLDLLDGNAGRLSFFLNLVNLVTLHAAIVQAGMVPSCDAETSCFVPITSPYIHQRLIEEMHCGYRVGQLGVVTLFELKRQILFQGYPLDDISGDDFLLSLLEELNAKASNKYSPSLHPKVVYSLVQGRISDPKLEIICPDTIEEQFQNAVARCMAQIKALSTGGKRKIIFPWQMKFFINSRVDLDASSEELRDSLQRLVPEGFLVDFEKEKPTFGIVLDLPAPHDDQQPAAACGSHRVAPAVLSYLENRSPLIGQLVKFMQPKVAQPLLIGDRTPSQSPLENLLRQYYAAWAQQATQSGHVPWLRLALEGRASGPLVWEALQGAAAQGDAVSALTLLDLVDAVEGLGRHPDLMAYQQALFWNMASQSGDEGGEGGSTSEPWRYALCIRDLSSRAECVLANYIRWPDEHAVSAMEEVLAHSSKESHQNLHLRLSRELRKVTLYKEVEERLRNAPQAAFESWRDIAHYSLSDPALVLEQLGDSRCYDCAARWADLHDVPLHCQAVVTELRVLEHLHKDPPESSAAFQIVSSAETEAAAFLLCQNALRKLDNCQGKIHTLDIVLNEYRDCLAEDTALTYQKLSIGLRMFLLISPHKRDDYVDLDSHPTLLFEQLLMNTEIDCVGECLKVLAQLLEKEGSPLTREMVDNYLEKYASKALELLLLPTPSSEPDTTLPSSATSASPQGPSETFTMPVKPPPESEWIPDKNVVRCMVCQEEHFGIFSRRHHCRRCGRVVCSSCSQQTMHVEGHGKREVRVCDDCVEQSTKPTAVGVEAIPPELPSSRGLRYNPNESPSPLVLRPPRKSTPLQSPSRDTLSRGTTAWILHANDEENVFIREHFYYERAPSVSLCLSILAKHSSLTRCASFILSLCDNLFAVLSPKAACDTLVDYGLIISIMHSLMLNAKVKCEEVGHSGGFEWCDAYLRRLDIVELMVTNNCQHLMPDEMLLNKTEKKSGLDPQLYWQPERKLRDRLIEAERMELALEVATKCRLEKSGIFASWGLALLRVGDWAAAREKFSFCLQKPKDRGKSAVENPLLQEIIASLEKSTYAGHSKAAAVFCAIGSLKSIRDPNVEVKFPTTELKSQVLSECRYYLEKYGTHRSMLELLLRRHETTAALKYFLAENCDLELLAESVVVPALKRGDIDQVLSEMKSLDPTLYKFWPSLLVVCRHLQRNGLFHCLYHMQIFMEDYIRAAMTSIQFFERPPTRSYSDLHRRLQHLADASFRFETYLDNCSKRVGKKVVAERQVLEMPPNEVTRYLSMVKLQIEVTRFLHLRESEAELIIPVEDNGGPPGSWSVPTLFGSIARKCELTCLILTNGKTVDEGFGVAFRIIEEHLLSGMQIFQRTSRALQRHRGAAHVNRLVDCIKTCGYPEKYDVDAVVMVAVKVIIDQDEEKKDLEILVKCLKSDVNKIEAYMLAGRLKSAYLLAVRQNRTEHIRRIMALAEEANQESIRAICEKRLQGLEQR